MSIKDRIAVLEEIDFVIDELKGAVEYLEENASILDEIIAGKLFAKNRLIIELEKLAKGI